MEDTVSRTSCDSAVEEFVVVNVEPKLQIAGDGGYHELERKLTEVMSDDATSINNCLSNCNKMSETIQCDLTPGGDASNNSENVGVQQEGSPESENVACSNASSTLNESATNCKNSAKAHGDGLIGWSDISSLSASCVSLEDDTTVFTGVTYLGSALVDAPRSQTEITRNMVVLNSQHGMAIPVSLSVPGHSEGIVRLVDPVQCSEIATYPISRILFCARGPAESAERRCFAFTCSPGESIENPVFQCHVFRCDVNESHVAKLLYCFATAFRRTPKSPSILSDSLTVSENNVFQFHVSLEFRELDVKGNFTPCPKDKNVFKLRCNVEKKIVITVVQTSHGRDLKIERCFGLLLSPGRNVKDGDMHVIDMVSMGLGNDNRSYVISANWDPTDPSFEVLNTETAKDSRVFLTIAVDMVIEGIQEPVRFIVETRAKIFPSNERFWYFSTKPLVEQFILKLKEVSVRQHSDVRYSHTFGAIYHPRYVRGLGVYEVAEGQLDDNPKNQSQLHYEVVSIESQSDLDRKKASLSLMNLKSTRMESSQEMTSPQEGEAEDSDNDEPLLSGSGIVSKDVVDENLLDSWHDVLRRWHQNLRQRPKQVQSLVRKGIPEALRGEVWQLLAECTESNELLEAYRVLITRDSPCDQVILRDINRTFPAHDFFKDAGGVGQDALYKISKAYSLYDEETGYCQGLSFLAAALLLHMPEEQAFCVLVSIMSKYQLRDLFKQGFEELHLKFFQLEKLMQDYLEDLYMHFMDLGLAAHMYASQWFLTLFTAKFPLFMVYHIVDLFLCEGMETLFNVALALLKTSRRDLLALDFEGVLKYFRVQLPKKFKSEEAARDLLHVAVSMKVSAKKLKKFEKEYFALKEQQEDPIERLQRENKRLAEANLRLEQENDDLAHELVNSKISLRNDLDYAEDRCDVLNKELLLTRSQLLENEEEMKRLESESQQLKEVCRRELDRSESENTRNQAITSDYKQICSQLSERLEKQQTAHKEEIFRIKDLIQSCEQCSQSFSHDGHLSKNASGISGPAGTPNSLQSEILTKEELIRELELELAQTKLALVESECKNQDLLHQISATALEVPSSKNTWFQKTLSSIKEVTNKAKDSAGSLKEGGLTGSSSKEPIAVSKEPSARKDSFKE